jgi:chemotaxis protein methyltransferase CheR
VAKRLGLSFDDSKLDELADVLRRRVSATSSSDVESYLCLLGTSLQELREVIGHLTIPETYFFRIPDHLRAFQEVVLPESIRSRSSVRQLSILSAGCASGEEPYTIAMLVQGRTDLAGWRVIIKGIDVNPAVIAKGRIGRYSPWSLREIDPKFKERYFRPIGRDFQLHDSIREMVSLEEGNLMDPQASFWEPDAYDVIFFRNAFMYLSPEAGQSVVARMASSLARSGYLFMGPAETLRGVSHDFRLCHTHETFYYQLRTDSADAPQSISRSLAPSTRTGNLPSVPEASFENTGSDWSDSIRQATEHIRILAHVPKPPAASGPATPTMAGAERPPVDLSLAMNLLLKERFEQALAVLQTLPPEDQISHDVQLLQAILLTNHGDFADARQACSLVLKMDELNAGAYYVMALCSEHEGDNQTAMEHDQTAIYLDPSFAMPHLHLGLSAKRGSTFDLAVQELSRALLLLPREDGTRILLFGGGFSRNALMEMCRRELQGCRGQL